MGLFGGLGKLAGKGLKALKGSVGGIALSAIPGGGIASKIAGRIGRIGLKKAAAAGVVAGGLGVAAMSHMGAGGTQSQLAGGMMSGRRRRRINPGNVRAMRRAVSRVTQGAKLYRKMFSITHGHIKGAPGVKVKRGRSR